MEAYEAQVIEWMTRVFAAATSGPSIFHPECFEALHRALSERFAQDRIAVVVREPGSTAFRLAVRAGTPATDGRTHVAGGLYVPTPTLEHELVSGETLVVDDTVARRDLFGPHAGNTGARSYVFARIPLEGTDLLAWLLFAWSEPGRASTTPMPEIVRVAQLLRAFVPSAHHAARAERLARMLDALASGVMGLDERGRIVELNRTAGELFRGAAPGTAFQSLIVPEDAEVCQRLLRDRESAGRVLLRLRAERGGVPLDVSALAAPPGGPAVTQLHLADATRRLAAEAELNARERELAFLRELAETAAGELEAKSALGKAVRLVTERLPVSGAAVVCVNREQGILGRVAECGVRESLTQALWSLPAATLGEPCRDADTAARHAVPSQLKALAAECETLTLLPLCHADQLVGAALFVTSGEPAARTRELLQASARTMAVALHAGLEYAEAVRIAGERRQLLDLLPSIVFRLDPATGATLYANAAVERILGVPVSSALGLPGLEGFLCDEAEREAMAHTREEVSAGSDSAWMDQRYRRIDGRVVTLRTRLYRVTMGPVSASAAAQREMIEGVAQDVTDEIEVRKQLVHADRLRSLGMLAAGVAHEINNPAAFILLGVQQLGRVVGQLPDEPGSAVQRKRIAEVLSELSDGIQRIVHIVGELKLFTRIPESAFSTPVDVNRLITSAVTLAQAELRRKAQIAVELGELPPLPGDHARLGQVFVNLLINAAQAIPPGNEEGNLVRVITHAEGDQITVTISDTGVGIAPENLSRIFDPFFTTKAPGEGTGLGLAISYDLVRRAGGVIEVESVVGQGTTFVVRLPVRAATRGRESRPAPTPAPAGARVLIVEDEQHLAVAMARALATTYLVERAPDAAAALEILERGGEEFAAVLCDLRMPGMDGREFYRRVRARWPALASRFVFLTGLGRGAEYEPFVRSTDRPVLEKPFEMSDLEEAVARVVGVRR